MIVLAERSGQYYQGSSTARAMWCALQTHAGDLSPAAQSVATEFDVPVSQVRADLETFVGRLLELSLLEVTA